MASFGYNGFSSFGEEVVDGDIDDLLQLDLDDLFGLPVAPPVKRPCRAKGGGWTGLGSSAPSSWQALQLPPVSPGDGGLQMFNGASPDGQQAADELASAWGSEPSWGGSSGAGADDGLPGWPYETGSPEPGMPPPGSAAPAPPLWPLAPNSGITKASSPSVPFLGPDGNPNPLYYEATRSSMGMSPTIPCDCDDCKNLNPNLKVPQFGADPIEQAAAPRDPVEAYPGWGGLGGPVVSQVAPRGGAPSSSTSHNESRSFSGRSSSGGGLISQSTSASTTGSDYDELLHQIATSGTGLQHAGAQLGPRSESSGAALAAPAAGHLESGKRRNSNRSGRISAAAAARTVIGGATEVSAAGAAARHAGGLHADATMNVSMITTAVAAAGQLTNPTSRSKMPNVAAGGLRASASAHANASLGSLSGSGSGSDDARRRAVVPKALSLPHALSVSNTSNPGPSVSPSEPSGSGRAEGSGSGSGSDHPSPATGGSGSGSGSGRGDSLARRLAQALGEEYSPDPAVAKSAPASANKHEPEPPLLPGGAAAAAADFGRLPTSASVNGGPQTNGGPQISGGPRNGRAPSGNGNSSGNGNGNGGVYGNGNGIGNAKGALRQLPLNGGVSLPPAVATQGGPPAEPLTLESAKRELLALAEAVAVDDEDTARRLTSALQPQASAWGNPYQRIAFYFLEALRIRQEGSGSLSWNTPIPITAEEFMESMSEATRRTPFCDVVIKAANSAFLEAAENATVVHVLDLGWWHGSQWPMFMRALATRPGPPPLLRVTRLEVPEESPAPCAALISLEDCKRALTKAATLAGLPFEFQGLRAHIMDLTPELLGLRGVEDSGEVLLVNGAKRFHTLSDGTLLRSNPRDSAMRAVRALNPKVVILGEMQADYNGPFFLRRFEECFDFSTALFECLDADIPRESARRNAYERLFMARDITNVIACEGLARVVRSEPHAKWVSRMTDAGFVQMPSRNALKGELWAALEKHPPGYGLTEDAGALTLTWRGRPILTSSRWRPAR